MQRGFILAGVAQRHSLVLTGDGMHRGSFPRDGAQLRAIHLARQHEYLHEKATPLNNTHPRRAQRTFPTSSLRSSLSMTSTTRQVW